MAKTKRRKKPIPSPRNRLKTPDGKQPQRLNRVLSSAGLVSRRKADGWIKSGRVSVDGCPVTEPGVKVIWGVDRIEVDGQKIPGPFARSYLMLNKPFGYICSLSDPQGRPLITDLIKDVPQRVYPVGRLDFDTLGLILLTNDGDWAHRLTHPRYRVSRTYKVTVSGLISDQAINLLKKGLHLEDGPTGTAAVKLLSRNQRQSVFRLTISLGRTRLVRRMLEAVGYEVIHLIRISYGSLQLGDLKIGAYRHLKNSEVHSMKKEVGIS